MAQLNRKRIALLYGSAGEGHHKAVLSLQQALQERVPDIYADVIDTYDFVNPFKRWQYRRAWIFASRYLSGPVRVSRDWIDKNPKVVDYVQRGFVPAAEKLASHMRRHDIGSLVSTHPHGAGLGTIIKKKDGFGDTYLAEIFTDLRYHEFYNNRGVDHFFSATEEAATVLKGVLPGANITVTGIPINPRFADPISRQEARAAFGIPDDDKPVVLVTRGSAGWGSSKSLDVLRDLARSKVPMHIIAHAGQKPRLVAEMRKALHESSPSSPGRGERDVLGWIDNMWDLFEAADLYIGKPGGMQISECLARSTPVLSFDPIPGTEEQNASLIEEKGAGIFLKKVEDVRPAVEALLSDKVKLTAMREAAGRMGKPDASRAIVSHILSDIGSG